MDKLLLFIMLGASAFDVSTTEYGLARGAEELHPFVRPATVRITVNAAVPVALWRATAGASDRDRLAICLGYVAVKAAAGTHNLLVIHGDTADPARGNAPAGREVHPPDPPSLSYYPLRPHNHR